MALTTAQWVRLRIQDQPQIADNTYYGDGSAATFNLPHRNLTSASAFVPGANGWTATGCTFNASGYVDFSGALSAQSAWRARYIYSTFSDDEISHFTAVGGDIVGASLEAVQTLMFDGLKRAQWAAPDGSTYDDTKAMTLLKDLYGTLKKEQMEDATGDGAIHSWAIEQGNV